MKNDRLIDLGLTGYEELFMSTEERLDAKKPKVLGYVFLLWERLLVGGQGYSSAARGYGCLFRFRKANHGKTPLKRAF